MVNKEKRKLHDKVHDELEVTLQQALKEKMDAEKKLADLQAVMGERDMMANEIDEMLRHVREQFRSTEKLSIDQ